MNPNISNISNISNRILNSFLKKQSKVHSILNLSSEAIEYPVYTEQFFQHRLLHNLPFKNQSFDFVFCKEPHKMFTNPYHMGSELHRIGKRGIIQTQSPVSVLLSNTIPMSKMISWTDTKTKTLCFMSYYSFLLKKDVMDDLDYTNETYHEHSDHPNHPNHPLYPYDIDKLSLLALNKSTILYDWYVWNNPEELNIKIIHPEDIVDYEMIFRESIEESIKNTFLSKISL